MGAGRCRPSSKSRWTSRLACHPQCYFPEMLKRPPPHPHQVFFWPQLGLVGLRTPCSRPSCPHPWLYLVPFWHSLSFLLFSEVLMLLFLAYQLPSYFCCPTRLPSHLLTLLPKSYWFPLCPRQALMISADPVSPVSLWGHPNLLL